MQKRGGRREGDRRFSRGQPSDGGRGRARPRRRCPRCRRAAGEPKGSRRGGAKARLVIRPDDHRRPSGVARHLARQWRSALSAADFRFLAGAAKPFAASRCWYLDLGETSSSD